MQADANQTQASPPVTLESSGLPSSAPGFALSEILNGTSAGRGSQTSGSDGRLAEFLRTDTGVEALQLWFGSIPQTAEQLLDCRRRLSRDIAAIDRLLTDQVNQILHHPNFQRLEASWRGLAHLWQTARELTTDYGLEDQQSRFQIRVLDVRKKELQRDFEDAVDFDQNALFRKVYEEEFGTAGGQPYGLLLADFEFGNHPDDLDLLARLSGIGAAAFAPVIAAAAPELFSVDDFNSMEQPLDLQALFEQPKYRKWRSLRSRPDSQFLGLTLPRVLMRAPWQDDGQTRAGFRFSEDVAGTDQKRYLWGSATWAFGIVVMRAFASAGWFADIRGVERGVQGGGLVTEFPTCAYGTDSRGNALRSSVDVQISDSREAELCAHGFIPLSHCKDTPFSVFYSNPSVHEPATYDDPAATANARVAAMMQYVLCSSRIAHYLKIQARDRIGALATPRQIEDELLNWLMDYVTPDEKAPPDMKARYPLRSAEVEVSEVSGEPGTYKMTMRLFPHYQLDQLSSSLSLVARRIDLAK